MLKEYLRCRLISNKFFKVEKCGGRFSYKFDVFHGATINQECRSQPSSFTVTSIYNMIATSDNKFVPSHHHPRLPHTHPPNSENEPSPPTYLGTLIGPSRVYRSGSISLGPGTRAPNTMFFLSPLSVPPSMMRKSHFLGMDQGSSPSGSPNRWNMWAMKKT